MTLQEFDALLVSNGLVSSAKVSVSVAAVGADAVVFSIERIGYPRTKREACYQLVDEGAIQAVVSAMASAKAMLEALTEDELKSFGVSPRRRNAR